MSTDRAQRAEASHFISASRTNGGELGCHCAHSSRRPGGVLVMVRPNGLRYPQVGGLGFCLGAGKTQSQKMFKNGDESQLSSACFVRRHFEKITICYFIRFASRSNKAIISSRSKNKFNLRLSMTM